MTRSIKAVIVSMVAGLAMAGIATTSMAAQPRKGTGSSMEVRYGDLNLQSEAGAAKLLGRLTYAANLVCGVRDSGVAYIAQRKQRYACRDVALQNAVVSVDHPLVTAMYQSKRVGANTKFASLN